jgi:hypothetical protein
MKHSLTFPDSVQTNFRPPQPGALVQTPIHPHWPHWPHRACYIRELILLSEAKFVVL